MNDPISSIRWIERRPELGMLLENHDQVMYTALEAGLEAEVIKLDAPIGSYVLKIWNKSSKPSIERQYKLLEVLHHHDLPVSLPVAWGIDSEQNQVLLTTYDGTPLAKLSPAIIRKLVEMMSSIHQVPLSDIEPELAPTFDFIPYFYPSIEHHADLFQLLVQLVERSELKQDVLIHGDMNLGNVLVHEGAYSIIDWTNGQRGDARYDIAWSLLLIRIFVGERYGSLYYKAILEEYPYSAEELARFEAMACIRGLLFYRAKAIMFSKDTLRIMKDILRSNPFLHEGLL
ncbi:hypothetical protein JCM10914A_02460 [Paenibacillus sp. JCM 10914]|uniref:aminoglycoside phosphotransferase family protein n=1 Tax=Paenibacillus sp. JCM 10914 TaxID=1236974 RepID=UPI0003CC5531|nr:aminoglycoside phosphotransferase family protein [Paenibacillus sp. JCM 10914]GAE06822.1 hypothetical protein JCM10914_3006 [Paenibacillus sp. JCM 10914]